MTLDEARAVLGPESSTGHAAQVARGGKIVPVVEGDTFYTWRDGSITITIGFTDGRVCDEHWMEDSLF
jgi:hypothetical protein